MSDHSKIEWTDATWSPTLGCDKVSDGCRGCYAIVQAWIKQHHPNSKIAAAYAGLVEQRPDGSLNWTGLVRALPERLELPLRWRQPRRIFVDSLSDLFHDDVPYEFIDAVWAVMALSPQHSYQILTKRPLRLLAYLARPELYDRVLLEAAKIRGKRPDLVRIGIGNPATSPLRNVWLGVSVENQDAADNRIPLLLQAPATIRFLSCEPLLGHVELREWTLPMFAADDPRYYRPGGRGVDWVIAGGESGPHARPMHPAWARSLRAQCRSAGVPFFFKQWGNWMPGCQVHSEDPFDELMRAGVWDRHLVALERNGCIAQAENDPIRGNWCDYQPEPGAWWMANVGRKTAGRDLDGREWSEYPIPKVAAP